MPRQRMVPTCHPEQPYQGQGLCKTCYSEAYRTGALSTRRNKRDGESMWDVIARRSVQQPNGCIDYPVEHATYPALNGQQLNRAVLERKLGRPIRDGYLAMHSCDRTQCINPEHLSEGSYHDNTQTCLLKGASCLALECLAR